MKKRPLTYVSEHLNLPADIACGSCIVTAYGRRHIYIENYKGIIEYTSELIKIQGKNCRVLVKGKALCLNYYTDSDMRIDGDIKEVNLID